LQQIEDEILPNALMIGVDYDLFWRLNPKSLKPFIKAFTLKQEQEDVLQWTLGLYVQRAIGSCFDKNAKYPEKPFSSKTVTKQNNIMSAEEIRDRVLRQANAINATLGKGKNG
jgi:hypothetical protein